MSASNPITLILTLELSHTPIFQCANYTGYIPRVGDWLALKGEQYKVVCCVLDIDKQCVAIALRRY